MVDHSDRVLAVWDGSSGGTKNCIDYAKEKMVPVDFILPNVSHKKGGKLNEIYEQRNYNR